ncbi:MAG: glycoside hydrolase family 16 protein, partial [Bacteroidales bacterium]
QILIDGSLFNTFNTKENPYFHDEFFLLFNLAVGGSFTGIIDQTAITALPEGQKAFMYIDWIQIIENK